MSVRVFPIPFTGLSLIDFYGMVLYIYIRRDMEIVMNIDFSNYYGETPKLPAIMGGICGGLIGFLTEIGPVMFIGFSTLGIAKAVSAAAISLLCGAIFGTVSGGLLGVLVAIAIPEYDLRK